MRVLEAVAYVSVIVAAWVLVITSLVSVRKLRRMTRRERKP